MDTNKRTSHSPGDIVKLADIDFVVLDSMVSPNDEDLLLFILAVRSQGRSLFGEFDNYAESDLIQDVHDWIEKLGDKGVDLTKLRTRNLDLTTLDGYKGYGTLDVLAAPLTLDEARKYAELIPKCDESTWLVTGWGSPYAWGNTDSLIVDSIKDSSP